MYDTGAGFNEAQLDDINLSHDICVGSFHSEVTWNNVQSVRLDLPSYIGFKVKDLSILINGEINLLNKYVSKMHGINLDNNEFLVDKKDPYLIINLETVVDIRAINLRMKF